MSINLICIIVLCGLLLGLIGFFITLYIVEEKRNNKFYIADLTQRGEIQAAATYQSFPIWIMVGAIYFVIVYLLTMLSNYLERRVQLR